MEDMAMNESNRPSDQIILTHGGQITDHGGIVVESLLDNIPVERVTVGFAIYAPGSKTGDTPVTHPGHEFLVLLEGSIQAEVESQTYTLNPGDILRFPSTKPHRGWNPGDATARALFVN